LFNIKKKTADRVNAEQQKETSRENEITVLKEQIEALQKANVSSVKVTKAIESEVQKTKTPTVPQAKKIDTTVSDLSGSVKSTVSGEKIAVASSEGTTINKTNDVLTAIDIVAKLKPSVVFIDAGGIKGSGFIVDRDGYILTNAHVVRGVYAVKITLSKGSIVDGYVVSIDKNNDVALIKIDAPDLIAVEFGDSTSTGLPQGIEVYAFGFPFGIDGDVSFKDGTVSRRTTIDSVNYIETTVQIHRGNSGGPLVNKQGKVVGMNTAVYGTATNDVVTGETIKLALPGSTAQSSLSKLKSTAKTVTPTLFAQAKLYTTYLEHIDSIKETINKGVNIIIDSIKTPQSGSLDVALGYFKDVTARFNDPKTAVYPRELSFTQSLSDSYTALQSINDDAQKILPIHKDLLYAISIGVYGGNGGVILLTEQENVWVAQLNRDTEKFSNLTKTVADAAAVYFQ